VLLLVAGSLVASFFFRTQLAVVFSPLIARTRALLAPGTKHTAPASPPTELETITIDLPAVVATISAPEGLAPGPAHPPSVGVAVAEDEAPHHAVLPIDAEDDDKPDSDDLEAVAEWKRRRVSAYAARSRQVRLADASPAARRAHFVKKVAKEARGSAIYVGGRWRPLSAEGAAVLAQPSLQKAVAETTRLDSGRNFASDGTLFLSSAGPVLTRAFAESNLDVSNVSLARAEFVERAVLAADRAWLVADETAADREALAAIFDLCEAQADLGVDDAALGAILTALFSVFLGASSSAAAAAVTAGLSADELARFVPEGPFGELPELTAALSLTN
jgi:hypothetical protein